MNLKWFRLKPEGGEGGTYTPTPSESMPEGILAIGGVSLKFKIRITSFFSISSCIFNYKFTIHGNISYFLFPLDIIPN